ncbi:MAG: pyridoxal-phosphate dependent enzyme [Bacteroidetes bacterium]|nr:pyridoxal-phosphate dependent enzyme [Bacteroidota bacterium]
MDILRLDLLHPVVSGNKFYKLKNDFTIAIESKAEGIGTFGGAFSNHIVACAFACKEAGIPCTGIIRGEEPSTYNPTLLDAKNYGMHLHFVSRIDYKDKEKLKKSFNKLYWIPEGGYGRPGASGISELFEQVPSLKEYTHIICAVGTGTTMAGLLNGSLENQEIIGISAMKNNLSLEKNIRDLLSPNKKKILPNVLHDFHFGGYAKYTGELIDFMNYIWDQFAIPLDFVYTAKAFFAMVSLMEENFFPADSHLLFLHSGGLQGNRSLPANTLQF